MASWRKPFSSRVNAVTTAEINPGEFSDGSLKYVGERGGNDAPLTYQEATGAPVENDSPLGYSVGPVTIVLLNVTYMIGTGIYSTPSAILSGTGSVGLSLIYWTLGYLLCLASGAVYLEFTAYFPSRSGSEVVFLEQAFPRPTWFFPTTFAVQNVILSFGSSNAVGLVFNTKYAYYFSNAVGLVKVITIIFVIFTGFAVLGGHTSVEDPKANFRKAFEGSSSATGYGLTNALYRIIFSYGGYNGAFNLVNEVKIFLIVMPWYPPAGGMYAGDVSFWYATYVVTGIGILLACGLYYWTWVYLLPRWKGYRLRQEVLSLDDGVQTHRINKIPISQLDEWDENHDATGRLRETGISTPQIQEKGDPSVEISGSEKAV
ncbi:hypothetical protein AUP68_00551 [Ilyonectria robusta]